ncbi:hypothetical protein [Tissierella praeacuta]|uniref:hypothetical protein n=1 Tax=Tissierella praeacuta TaxID=43131 RepID=UPI00333FC24F
MKICLILKLEYENNCVIEIIAGGGSQGLLNSTWGAEISRIKEIIGEIKNIFKIISYKLLCTENYDIIAARVIVN